MKRHIIVTVILLVILVVFTFPLFFHLGTYIPGFFSTDEPYHLLWNSWRISYSVQNHLPLDSSVLTGFPFVTKITPSFCSPFLWDTFYGLLSRVTSGVLTYNLQVLLNMFLSALFMYLLCFLVTGSSMAGFFSAIIFAFCPYQAVRSWQHLGLTYNEWLPLIMLSSIVLRERPVVLNRLFFMLSLILLFSFDYQISYFGMLILVTLLIYSISSEYVAKRHIFELNSLKFAGICLVILLISLIILSPQFSFILKNGLMPSYISKVIANYQRPFGDLFAQSARPLSYFLPSAMHPVFGSITERFIGSSIYGTSFTEHTLYLGVISLIFAVFALMRSGKPEYFNDKERFYIRFFAVLTLVAWLFSQPPWWNLFGLKLYMPSYFMYKILPVYRAYCRFGIVVIFGIAGLAGFGLKSVIQGLVNARKRIIFVILACGLLLFEFWNWPPYKVIDLSKVPAAYYWLRDQPSDTVIGEYPLDIESANMLCRFYQTVHNKRIINGTVLGSSANVFEKTITRLSDINTAKELHKVGVKFVVVHKDDYISTELKEMLDELKRIPSNPYLKLIKSFPAQECRDRSVLCIENSGDIDIYQILPAPAGR